jgi:trehalose 6-phosphate synthase
MSPIAMGEDPRPQHVRTAPFVIVSDLLPGERMVHEVTGARGYSADDPITGALRALAFRRGATWIGRRPERRLTPGPANLRELRLDETKVQQYDAGYNRRTLWPLYHDLVRPAAHHAHWQLAYRHVNQAFAAAAAVVAAEAGTVWVHDYQLQLVPGLLRRLRPDLRIGFFLSTPFPSADLFEQLPMHGDILRSLLGADVVGFQTAQAAENFLRLTQDVTRAGPHTGLARNVDATRVGVYPTAVDTAAILAASDRDDVNRRAVALRNALGNPTTVVLSIDAADESQGIQSRLRAIGDLFRTGELKRHDVTLVQIVAEDPTGTGGGNEVIAGVDREVARLNGQFASVGQPCVHYMRSTPGLEERVALYLAADIMMATPFRQGASLSALEYAAVGRPDSALILSDFTGTAAMLREAFLINPHDDEQIRTGIRKALACDRSELARRMQSMHEYVAAYDHHAWARTFLAALEETRLRASALDKRGHQLEWPGYGGPTTLVSPRSHGTHVGREG